MDTILNIDLNRLGNVSYNEADLQTNAPPPYILGDCQYGLGLVSPRALVLSLDVARNFDSVWYCGASYKF